MNSPVTKVISNHFFFGDQTISFIYASCILGGALSFNQQGDLMTAMQQEAIILLYPSVAQTTKELRASLSEFCKSNNISIVDIISFTDEYDYLALRRLLQIIKYNTKHISLVANRNPLTTIPLLMLLSILETINSPYSVDMALDFLHDFKETPGNNQDAGVFYALQPKKVQRISYWMSDIKYFIIRA